MKMLMTLAAIKRFQNFIMMNKSMILLKKKWWSLLWLGRKDLNQCVRY